MNYVVDTNVPIAANGRGTHATHECQYRCIDFLQALVAPRTRDVVLLDYDGAILKQYRRYLKHRGEPGVGDFFFKYLHDHMYTGLQVQRVAVARVSEDARGFEELPKNSLDPSDRIFLAVAIAGNATVVNALDSDWRQQAKLIAQVGANVRELCPDGC